MQIFMHILPDILSKKVIVKRLTYWQLLRLSYRVEMINSDCVFLINYLR